MVEYGPMRMFIDGSVHGLRKPELCVKAAQKAIDFLGQVAAHKESIWMPYNNVLCPPPQDLLIYEMWRSVSLIGDEDLTPMAAVAGTIADATADYLVNEGLTKIIVNNGGDLAIRVLDAETASIGIRPDIMKQTITHRVILTPEMNIGGVCTSGIGGRSFSRGIASSAVAFAARGSIADAAATAIANATYVSSPEVGRCLAELLDPNTDLKGVEVTCSVGALSNTEIQTALEQGLRKAENLIERGIIAGAFIAIKHRFQYTSSIQHIVSPM